MTAHTFTGTAPGRLDVMGGIADYSGSLVLQMPISQTTTVKFTPRHDFTCVISSQTSDGPALHATLDFRDVINESIDYDFSRVRLRGGWHSYVVGCAIALQKKKGIKFTGGDFTIDSQVPLGKGVSSSASLEVATMKAIGAAFNISFEGTSLAVLAQEVENQIVGAPCGLMDQLATTFGEPGKLLPILCQPDLISAPVSIPPGIRFIGIDSGVRHSVGGASYSDVRCAAFMGYTVIAKHLGVTTSQLAHARTTGDRSALPFKGFLCNISVTDFESRFRKLLPQKVSGSDFKKEFGETIDKVTIVQDTSTYPVLQATVHPIYENQRVNFFKSILDRLNAADFLNMDEVERLGTLMFESHESYGACGLGSAATDDIVQIARNEKHNGIYGAKITGGGSGGTVCLLAVGDDGRKTAKRIHEQLCVKSGVQLAYFEQ